MLLLPILALLCAPTLYLILGKPRYLKTTPPTKAPITKISIIIPARDEQTNIANLLNSLNKQTQPPHQILVIDDHSTDQTPTIARDLGATLIPADPLPSDWKGKPAACQQGADQATGTWLLFLDADTTLAPTALEHLQTLTKTPETTHSIYPHHTVSKPYEQLSLYFNTLMLAGINAFGTSKTPEALFGQTLLISKQNYTQIGGHTSVKNQVLENFHLAKTLHQNNLKTLNHLGHGLITMRMFPHGLTELWNSWKKGFAAGATTVDKTTLILSSIWITGAMLSITSIALLILIPTSVNFLILTLAAYTTYALTTAQTARLAGTFSTLTTLLYPIPLIFYQTLFFTSIINKKRGKTTQWKGRDI